MMAESILKAVQENWILFVVVYFLKPDLAYQILDKILVSIGFKAPETDEVVTPDKLKIDWGTLFELLLRKTSENDVDARDEVKALMSKVLDSDVVAAKTQK